MEPLTYFVRWGRIPVLHVFIEEEAISRCVPPGVLLMANGTLYYFSWHPRPFRHFPFFFHPADQRSHHSVLKRKPTLFASDGFWRAWHTPHG